MATLRFGPEDRDEHGFVKPPPPRSLADLLPSPAQAAPSAQPATQPMTHIQLIIGVVLALIAIGLVLVLLGRTAQPTPDARSAPTVAAGGASAPTPASATTTAAARLLVAFAAPDGAALGAIESTREMTATAHAGDGWVQADVAGSGLIWLRASDVPELAGIGPDLAPRPTQPAATQRPIVAPAAPPLPAPTDPPQCVTVGTEGDTIQKCGYGDLDQLQAEAQAEWIAKQVQSGAHVVPVMTATPYPVK